MREDMSVHRQIMELAEGMTDPEETERALLEALCTSAEATAAGRLKDGLTPKDCGFTYLCAAAMLAASGLLSCRDGGDVEQFTAGDVTIRTGKSSGCEAGASLRRHAAALMADYWKDDAFAFLGVRG